MKSKRLPKPLAGAAVFLAAIAIGLWVLKPAPSPAATAIDLDTVVRKIESREVIEVLLQADKIQLTGADGRRYHTNVGSDPTREALLKKITDYNQTNAAAPIKFSEEPASSGWGWIALINASWALLAFLMMSSVTVASIIYIVKTLTGNKS